MLLHACKNRIALDQWGDCGGWSECRFRFHAALLLVTNIVANIVADVVTDVADYGIPSPSRTAVIDVTPELLSFGLILSIDWLFQAGTEYSRTGVESGKYFRATRHLSFRVRLQPRGHRRRPGQPNQSSPRRRNSSRTVA